LGKSANLEYLAGFLPTVGQVPFRFLLDEKADDAEPLPGNEYAFWQETLPDIFRG